MIKRLILTAALAATPAFAFADGIEDVIAARQGYFKLLGMNMAPLAAMAKGEMDYDEAAAVTAAGNIETLSQYNGAGLFAAGSSSEDVADSEALPGIWQNMDDFGKKFAALQQAAAGASEAVKGGRGSVGPVLKKLGGSCKGCHDEYRKK